MDDWAYIGRETTLAAVEDHVRDGRSVVVTAEAGAGKSRLLYELGQRVEAAAGGPPVRLVATATAASIPFGALAPLVAIDERRHDVVDERRPEAVDVLASARLGLQERLGDGARLLLVDDAPRLDAGSATFLHQVVIDRLCPVVVTARAGDPTPDAVAALIAEPTVTSVQLDPLDARTIERLAEHVLGGQCGTGVVRALGRLSSGNPLLLRELIYFGRAAGWLAERGGVWRVVDEPAAPPRMQELVESRLAALGASARRGMEVLACVERIELDQASSLVSDDDLEQLEAHGLIKIEVARNRPLVVLAHPLHGEAVRASLSTLRRRRIATELAAVVEAGGFAAVGAVTRVVQWRLEAGIEVDPALITTAAREAFTASDFELAEQLAVAARERGGGFEAALVLGEALLLSGRHEAAEQVLVMLDTQHLDSRQRAALANARAFNLAQNLDREADALEVLEAALEGVSGADGDLIRARLVGIHALAPRPRRAIDLAEPMLVGTDERAPQPQRASDRAEPEPEVDSEFEPELDPDPDPDPEPEPARTGGGFYRVAYAASIALATIGRLDEAVALGRRGFEAHARSSAGARQIAEAQHVGPILALIAIGDLTAAEQLSAAGRDACADGMDSESQATFALLEGMVALTAGRVVDATRHMREATAINTELDDRAALRWTLGGSCISAALAGDRAAAAAARRQLDAVPSSPTQLLDAVLVDRGRAWECLARHDLAGAAELLRSAASNAAASEQRVAEVLLLHDLVDVDRRAADAERLADVGAQVDGPLAATMIAHATALIAREADGLEAAATAFGELGARIHAAIAASQAAAVFAERGFDRRYRALSAQTAALLAACQGARPPLLSERASPVTLTRREREVATLASDGCSNREIGERLYLSVRTVENHLQRVYDKLGVTSRADLATALRATL